MKKLLYTLSIILTVTFATFSQSTTITPGSVLPQMTTAQRTGLANPVNGMMVYDTNTNSYWFYQQNSWVELPKGGSSANYWELNGLHGNEIKNTNSGGFWSANPTTVQNSIGVVNTVPVDGDGTRLMWIPSMSAFRVGTVALGSKAWDKDSVGVYSFGMGNNTKAKGAVSIAMGLQTTASGAVSTAMGEGTTASGDRSIAMGSSTVASGNFSTAMGSYTTASGSRSTAMGEVTTASGTFSTAMGSYTTASGYASTAMGSHTTASGNASTAMGDYTIASGYGSTAMGGFTTAKAVGSTAIGYFNNDSDSPSSEALSPTDRIFQIGNGSFLGGRKNALTVLRSGRIGVNNINLPLSPLHIKGIGTNNLSHLVLESSNNADNSKIYTNSFGLFFENSASSMNFFFRDQLGVTRAVIRNNGFIGSLVANPVAPLHLGNGPDTWERHIRLDYDPSNNKYGNIVYDQDGMKFRTWGTTDDFHFRNSINNALARINDNGNMTISGTLTQNSDSRLKKNITGLTNSTQKLSKLNGYHYHWIAEDRDSRLQTGLIAQEVQALFPELVSEDEDGYLSVNYTGLIPHLIEAVKDLQKENLVLGSINKDYSERLSVIEAKLKLLMNASESTTEIGEK